MTTGGAAQDNGPMADRPWVMRTYSGHSTARASNELYRTNLARGQTGLSIAFDPPTQNDIIKEYLSRGTYAFPPEPSRRLTVDLIAYTVKHIPRWNPINVCSYHLQEAGATPVQELAYALADAIGVLDAVRQSGQVDQDEFPAVVGRISFFCNA